ncbi:MAG: flagellar biosynthesis protein FlgN [Actinobacteria bacterium 13_1_20CM_3_71_11]|nr:MAG: flagellar biosynthesis protein FlgN [Actinobacteria bacterium 13_1_20CM_3_71_11]TML31556.1 MAG: flagellar protein FlgN [Actinomycetota bacterium]
MSLTDLSSVFWRLRELLELLLFKLEEEQLLLASARTRWVAHATREVEMVLDNIRQAEAVRAAHTLAVARELGLPDDVSLAKLVEQVPPPWNDLLREHRKAFLALTAEITALANANRDLLTRGQRAARETMMLVTGSVETYGARGETFSADRRARLIDEAM